MKKNKSEEGSYVMIHMLAAIVRAESGRLKSVAGRLFKWSHSGNKPHESQRHVRYLCDQSASTGGTLN